MIQAPPSNNALQLTRSAPVTGTAALAAERSVIRTPMNARWRTVFRSLVASEWLLSLINVGGSVPAGIQDAANQSFARDPRPFQFFLAVACSLGLLKIGAEIGLFLFKRWTRPLFAAVAIAGVLAPFAVAVLPQELAGIPNRPLDQSLAILLSMADGAIIALAYGSPVAVLFARGASRVAPSVESAG